MAILRRTMGHGIGHIPGHDKTSLMNRQVMGMNEPRQAALLPPEALPAFTAIKIAPTPTVARILTGDPQLISGD